MISLATDARASLHLDGIEASYGADAVLRGASLDVAPGEMVSLLGPSGCGKTTLLRSIAGLQPIDAGTVEISGTTMAGEGIFVAPEHRRVGMVFQDGALFPHLSVGDNVGFGLRGANDAVGRVHEVLELVDMLEFHDRMPGTLSGGQQQRVALARALAPSPSVLLLDEPFSALDAGLRHQVRRHVKQILSEVGITVVMVTHDQDEAFVMADRVAVMNRGEIVQVGTPADLYDHPHSAWIAGFVGEANVVDGTLLGDVVETFLGTLPVRVGCPSAGTADVLIRPEELQLVPGGAAEVTSVEYMGHDALYSVAFVAGDRSEELSIDVRTTLSNFRLGDRVDVKFVGSTVTAWPQEEPAATV